MALQRENLSNVKETLRSSERKKNDHINVLLISQNFILLLITPRKVVKIDITRLTGEF